MFLQNVHHSGQPMPGEEQEDIVMTGTQCILRNVNCPLSGKPVTELADPVRRYCRSSHLIYCMLNFQMAFIFGKYIMLVKVLSNISILL